MRVVQVGRFGGPEVLTASNKDEPIAGRGELLVAVRVAGVNRADVLFRSGGYHRTAALPVVPGLEACGTVVGIGPEVDGFQVGDDVVAWGATGAPGFYAERVAVPAHQVLRLPPDVDPAMAAVLPVAWLSAWYCLHRLARVAAGETVLVLAAGSGVGTAAVQVALAAGAHVIAATGSADKQDRLRAMGASHVIDSSGGRTPNAGPDLAAQVRDLTDGRGADVVLDLVGGPLFGPALQAAARAGRVVVMANVALAPSTIDTRDFYPRNVSVHGFQITDLLEHGWDPRHDLATLLKRMQAGQLQPVIDARFPLQEAVQAHRRLEERSVFGKVVLTVGTTS